MNVKVKWQQISLCIALLSIFIYPSFTQSQDDICDTAPVVNLLKEAQSAQQQGNSDNVDELLQSAIGMLEEMSRSCSIELLADEEVAPVVQSTTDTEGPLTADKEDGFYLVGIDIKPGHWETTGSGSDCYWARTSISGDTIANNYGYAGGTITIQDTDFQVEFNGCGTAVYVEGKERILAEDAVEPKESGFYTVGVEISPGLWRSTGKGDSCYVARLDENQEIIDNNFGNAGITINIQPTDYEVEFNDCGTWQFLGEP